MENQSNLNQDCGCIDGCCTPLKKSSTLKKCIFIAIILAVAAIVTVKLIGKDDTVKCCDKPETSCQQPKTDNNE